MIKKVEIVEQLTGELFSVEITEEINVSNKHKLYVLGQKEPLEVEGVRSIEEIVRRRTMTFDEFEEWKRMVTYRRK